MKKLLLLFLCLALGLCACGQTALPPAAAVQTPAASAAPTPEPTPEPSPEPTPAPLRFPDGSLHSREEQALDLSAAESGDVPELLELLGDLKELRHLNITRLGPVKGWEVLEEMTQLERLWIGGYTDIPPAELQKLPGLLPDTEVELDLQAGIDGHWRYLDGVSVPNARYELLREQMGYAKYDQVCAWYWNDPLYDPHD